VTVVVGTLLVLTLNEEGTTASPDSTESTDELSEDESFWAVEEVTSPDSEDESFWAVEDVTSPDSEDESFWAVEEMTSSGSEDESLWATEEVVLTLSGWAAMVSPFSDLGAMMAMLLRVLFVKLSREVVPRQLACSSQADQHAPLRSVSIVAVSCSDSSSDIQPSALVR